MPFTIKASVFYQKSKNFIPCVPSNNVDSEGSSSDDDGDIEGTCKETRKSVIRPVDETGGRLPESDDSAETLLRWPKYKGEDICIPPSDDENPSPVSEKHNLTPKPHIKKMPRKIKLVFKTRRSSINKMVKPAARRRLLLPPSVLEREKQRKLNRAREASPKPCAHEPSVRTRALCAQARQTYFSKYQHADKEPVFEKNGSMNSTSSEGESSLHQNVQTSDLLVSQGLKQNPNGCARVPLKELRSSSFFNIISINSKDFSGLHRTPDPKQAKTSTPNCTTLPPTNWDASSIISSVSGKHHSLNSVPAVPPVKDKTISKENKPKSNFQEKDCLDLSSKTPKSPLRVTHAARSNTENEDNGSNDTLFGKYQQFYNLRFKNLPQKNMNAHKENNKNSGESVLVERRNQPVMSPSSSYQPSNHSLGSPVVSGTGEALSTHSAVNTSNDHSAPVSPINEEVNTRNESQPGTPQETVPSPINSNLPLALRIPVPSPIDSDLPLALRTTHNPRLARRNDCNRDTRNGNAWRAGDIVEHIIDASSELSLPDELKDPIQYFKYFFDEEILSLMVEQTNLYSFQEHEKSMEVTADELEIFFGILLYMGVCSLPAIEDYWANCTRVPAVASVMPYKRFQMIRSHLHFVNNREDPGDDRMRKVRPLLDHMRKKCQGIPHERQFSVDEAMVAYKGTRAGNLRQYLPDKPSSKWGFKFFVRSGTSGITYDLLPYVGATTFDNETLTQEEKSMGVGAMAVLSLCKSIPEPASSSVTFDNWYTGLPLITYLKTALNIVSLGTIKKNRLKDCKMTEDKAFQKKGRGSCESKVNGDGVVVVKWVDNKSVCLAGTIAGIEPKGKVMRYDKNARRKIEVLCPRAVAVYNASMGGVDLSDMYNALYKSPTRARRWYFPIVGYLLDTALTNSFLMYKRDAQLLGETDYLKSLKEFRSESGISTDGFISAESR